MERGVVAYDHVSSVDESVGHKVEHQECSKVDHLKDYFEVSEECNCSCADSYIDHEERINMVYGILIYA
jgi:hypothetical protein